MFMTYVSNDLEANGPDYYRKALENCGCDGAMQEVLGLEVEV